ncbi:hypothetical protein ElyMa_002044700 [Elysia marginata]|uniref:Uncharacterized protein n=1 Tax=Elysia marginata TaxID=1093978 RepID=A0AAV4F775_9GAST|nr:hypothetical protein ElyMa_002044700 [Elysia marginata]
MATRLKIVQVEAPLTASEMQFIAKDLNSWEGMLCVSTIMRPRIQQTNYTAMAAALRLENSSSPADSPELGPDLAPSGFQLFEGELRQQKTSSVN